MGDRPLGSFEEGDNYRHGTVAKTQLRKKILREGWSQGISVDWVVLRNGAMESPRSHYSGGPSTRTMMCG